MFNKEFKKARKTLILYFKFDDKKVPEIESQFTFTDIVNRLFFKEQSEQNVTEIFSMFRTINQNIWFYNISNKSFEYILLKVLIFKT